MAIFSINIANDQIDRVIDALCANYQYRTQVLNPDFDPELEEGEDNLTSIDNPENSYQFANRIVREYLINNTRAYETQLAKQQTLSNIGPDPDITNPAE